MYIIPVILIIVIYKMYQHKNRGKFGAISFVIGVYVLMGFCASVLYTYYEYSEKFSVKIEPIIFFSLCLCVSFYGISGHSDRYCSAIKIENTKILRSLELFQIVSSFAAFIFFMPFAIKAMTGNIGENRLELQSLTMEIGSYGVLNSIFSLVGNIFPISILLAFINFATIGRGGSKIRANLLLFSSSIYIVYVLAYVGRDGIIYWLFTFIFFYLFFKDFVPKRKIKSIKKAALLIATPALFIFTLITLSRFSGEQKSEIFSLFDYAGSQIFYFCDQYSVNAPPMMGMMNFSQIIELFSGLTGSEVNAFNRIEWYEYFTNVNVIPWTFSTFIGSFLHDFGAWGTIVLLIIIAALTRLSIRKSRITGTINFTNILIFFLLVQIVLFGVFYYRQYVAFYAQITILLIAITFHLFRDPRTAQMIVKNTNHTKIA